METARPYLVAVPTPSLIELLLPAQLRWLFCTLIILSAASSVVHRETFAEFTATVLSADNVFSTGRLDLVAGTGNSFIGLNDMLAGDSITATIDIHNAGTINGQQYTFSTTTTPVNVLSTDALDGLQVIMDRCSVAWTGSTPYTCSGTQTTGVVVGRLLQTQASMGIILPAGAYDYLRITIGLPTQAGNEFQEKSVNVTFQWDVVQ